MVGNEVSNVCWEISIDGFPVWLNMIPFDSGSFNMDGSIEMDGGIQVGDGCTVSDQVDMELGVNLLQMERLDGSLEDGSNSGGQGTVFFSEWQMDDGISRNAKFDGSSVNQKISLESEGNQVQFESVGEGRKTVSLTFMDVDKSVGKFLFQLIEVDVSLVQDEGIVNWGEESIRSESMDSSDNLTLDSIDDGSLVSSVQVDSGSACKSKGSGEND